MTLKLFTSEGCPKCKILKKKLDAEGLVYTLDFGMEEIINEGFMSYPVLKVDDIYLDFKEAIQWVKELN
jgi:glutaredoxin